MPGEIIVLLETWVISSSSSSSSSSVLLRSRMFGEPVNGVSEEPELVVTLELVMSLLWSSVSRIVFIKSFRLSFSAINIIIIYLTKRRRI